MFPVPFLVINDVVMTSLLLLKTIYVSQCLDFISFMSSLRQIWILPMKIQLYDVIMTSDSVIVSIKFYSEVGHGENIILCNFGSLIISGFEVKEWEPSGGGGGGGGAKKSPISIGLNLDKL